MARKQINKNLVVAITLCGFALMIVLSALMLRQLQQRDPKYFVALAESAAAQGQWQQAAVFYEQAAQQTNSAKYLVEVGEMWLRDGDVQYARLNWRKALTQEPQLIEGHVRQLRLLLRMARLYDASQYWEEVRDAADAMLKVETEKTASQTALAQNARGLALIQLRDRGADADEGLGDLQSASQLAPESVDYSIDLAGEYVRREQMDKAEQVFAGLIAANTKPGAEASKVRVADARYWSGRGKSDEAERLLNEALTLAGDDMKALHDAKVAYADFVMRQWTQAMRDKNDADRATTLFDKAEAILRECTDADPEAFDAFIEMATLYRSAGKFAEVVDVCEKRISRGLSRKGVEATQNRMSAFTLMIQASEACMALGISAGQEGRIAERTSWLARAEQYVADARGEAPTHPRVLSQAGRVKIARGQERAGLDDLRAADEAYRSFGTVNWENRMIRARVHLQLNEAGAAKQVLEEVIDDPAKARAADAGIWNLYAQTLIQVGEPNRALGIVDRVLATIPDSKDAKRIKAAALERLGRNTEAGNLEKELSGSDTVRAILEARSASLSGDSERALTVLRKALDADPADQRIVSALVEELTGLNRKEEAQQIVNDAIAKNPNDEALRRLAISIRTDLTPEQRDQAMLKLIESEQDAYKKALSLVAFHLRKNNAAEALRAVVEAEQHLKAADTPMAQQATAVQHAALLRTKLRAASQVSDEAAMAAARDEGAKSNVDGAGGKSILGLYHLLRREYELAAQAFRDALAEQPTQVSSMVFLGQCLQSLGRADEARDEFERAARINPNETMAHQGLALLAQMRGDTGAFQRELAVCERLAPDDTWVREQVLVRTEEADPAAAILRREQQLAEHPDDAMSLQRLASLYETAKDQEKADRSHLRLIELQPDDLRVAGTAAAYFRRTDRAGRALEIVKHYAESRPTREQQAGAAILVANEYFQQKDLHSVERTLLDAADLVATLEVAQTLADFYFRQAENAGKAIVWFDKAVELAVAAQSPHLSAILERRIACLLDRNVNDLDRARKDVAELRRRFPDNAQGPLLDSEVHARAGQINEAVALLSEYLAKRPDDSYASFQRARYEMAMGRPAAAIDDLERIKRNDPLAFGGESRIILARLHDRAGRKDLWIAELESLAKDAPDSPRALQELVEAYIREKRYADAERIVTAQINRTAEKPDARWFFLRGRISLELKDADKALADFRKGAEVAGSTPAAISTVLDAYIRLARFVEGAAYYVGLGASNETDPVVLAQYAQLSARAGQPDSAIESFRRAMALATACDSNRADTNSTDSSPARSDALASLTENLRAAFPTDQAVALFEKTPASPPIADANDRILIRLYRLSKKPDAAVALLDKAIDRAQTDCRRASLFHEKGDTHQEAGQMDRAIEAYEEALKYDAENWVTLNNVAYVLSDKRGDNKLALPYAKKAAAKAENPYTLDTLGWIYVGLGDYVSAAAELSRAIRLNPDYALPYYHLGESYRRGGRFDDAADILAGGRRMAESAGDADLLALIDASLEKNRSHESSP